MSFFARVTEPLAPIDGPVNRLNDLTVRVTPWVWWPASPPRRDRRLGAGQHASYLAWSVAGYLAGDVLAKLLPEEHRSIGARLRNERIVTGLATVVVWLLAVGAWDRRAERLRSARRRRLVVWRPG
jgi:hypothetical protein